jgi:dipeptidyl aminopeptidase/acylaminoacyl peptidase
MVKRQFRPGDLYRLKALGDVSLSPDGRRTAFVVTEPQAESDRNESSIWVVPVDGSSSPRRFSEGPRDVNPRWSPDGSRLAYISMPADKPMAAHLRVADLDGGVPAQVGELPGPVSSIAWSPDSAQVAVVCRVGSSDPEKLSPKERNAGRVVRGLAARFNGVGWKEGRLHVFLVDAATGAHRQLTRGDYDHADPAFSPDGSLVAFAADRRAGHDDRQRRSDVWVVSVAGGAPRRLTSGKGLAISPQFSADGALVAFAGTDSDRWDVDSYVFVVPTDGSGNPNQVAPKTDLGVVFRMAGMPPAHRWSGSSDIDMLVMDRGGVVLRRARIGEPQSRQLIGGDIEISGFDVRPGGRAIVYAAAWVDRPSELFVRAAGGERRQITHFHDDFLAEVELVPAHRRMITRPDATDVEYFTLRRPSGATGRLPVHLDIHGGPNGWWPLAVLLPLHQAIASAGYVVVLPNPRGSAGYGQQFRSACTGDWGGNDCDDILACCDDLLEQGVGDRNRTFVSGYSYGGFMTAWIAGHSGRFRAATACAAVVDMTALLGTSDLPEFLLFNMGGTWWDRTVEYEKRSPLTYLNAVTTPTLVVHWEGDLRVPIGQAEELYVGLRVLGKKAEFVRYPGGAHGVHSPSQTVDWITRTIDWNVRHDHRPRAKGGKTRAPHDGPRA